MVPLQEIELLAESVLFLINAIYKKKSQKQNEFFFIIKINRFFLQFFKKFCFFIEINGIA